MITEPEPEPEPELEPEYPWYPPEDGSDIDSTCAEVGTNDDDDDDDNEDIDGPASPIEERDNSTRKEKMSSTDESSDAAPEWTREEDRLICVRKSEAKSWAEIGKELERGKKECQLRYRMLSSHAKQLGITTEKLARLYVDEDEEKAKAKSKKSGKIKDKGKGKDEDEDENKRESKARDGKGKGKSKSGGKSKKAATKSNSKPHTKSKSKKEKNRNVDSDSSSNSDDEEEGEEEEEEEDKEEGEEEQDGDEEAEDPEAEYWAQRHFIYDTLYGNMYPDQKALRPDRFYSESDCRVLAGLEARYRANKWLYIQADFCNATGRMVEAELLRAKFYEDRN